MHSLVVPVVIPVIATGGKDMTLRTHIGNAPIKKLYCLVILSKKEQVLKLREPEKFSGYATFRCLRQRPVKGRRRGERQKGIFPSRFKFTDASFGTRE